MYNLYEDVIHEICHHLFSKDVSSLLSINKHYAKTGARNEFLIKRRLLAKELQNAQIKERSYYKNQILKLEVGDRVTDQYYNYRVVEATKKKCLLQFVDMYGNPEDCFLETQLMTYFRAPTKPSAFWIVKHGYDIRQGYDIRLYYGIIKHFAGPKIDNINCRYLNYVTKPKGHLGGPEPQMMVTVLHKIRTYEYYIYNLFENCCYMTLVEPTEDDVKKTLIANKVDNLWKIKNRKYKIQRFGGWINQSVFT